VEVEEGEDKDHVDDQDHFALILSLPFLCSGHLQWKSQVMMM
jgi:hypothetical protein